MLSAFDSVFNFFLANSSGACHSDGNDSIAPGSLLFPVVCAAGTWGGFFVR